MCEAFQYATVLMTVPTEEYLIIAENAANTIHRYTTVLEDMQVVVPELVLNKERHLRTNGAQEATRIRDSVQREVADNISSLVVLTHLIA